MRLTFPMTSKCRCGGRIQFGFAGYAPGLIVLNRYRPSASVVWTAKPSKFGSSGARIRVARVGVAPSRVGLPQLDPGPSDRLPFDVEHPPHHVDDIARGASRLSWNDGQIGALIDTLDDG